VEGLAPRRPVVPWCTNGNAVGTGGEKFGWIPELLFSEADVILRDPMVVVLVSRHSTGRVDASPQEPDLNMEGES
jgi:hypothetical protein